MTRFLLLAGASGLALCVAAPERAAAQCLPDAPAPGATVFCGSDDGDGFASAADDLSVSVDMGVTVENPGGDAVSVTGLRGTVVNDGTIAAADDGVALGDGDAGTPAFLENFGAIAAGDDGVTAGAFADVMNVGSIDAGGRGVETGARSVVFNDGAVTAGAEAVKVGDASTVENFGDIVSTGDKGVEGDDRTGVVNYGLIDAAGDAVDLGDGDLGDPGDPGDDVRVYVDNWGTIRSGDKAVDVGDAATVYNAVGALIEGSGEGVETGDDARIFNDGTIAVFDDGLNPGERAVVVNTGAILSSGNDAIDIDSGLIDNWGRIESMAAGEAGVDFDPSSEAVSTIVNRAGGVIEGDFGVLTDPANDKTQDVANAGRITGRSGTAMALGAGADSLTLFSGGLIEGLVDFGDGADDVLMSGIMGGVVGGPLGGVAPATDPFGATPAEFEAALRGGMAFFDGGLGDDAMTFDLALGLDDMLALSMLAGTGLGDSWALTFANADGSQSVIGFNSFEFFGIGGAVYDLAELRGAVAAPIPLPATAPLLLGGLALAGWAARRRAAA